MKNVLSPSRTDVGSHNPPLSKPNILSRIRSSLQSMWDLTIHSLSGPNVLVGTPPGVHPLVHRPVSDSDIICNDPSPPLTDIILFNFSRGF